VDLVEPARERAAHAAMHRAVEKRAVRHERDDRPTRAAPRRFRAHAEEAHVAVREDSELALRQARPVGVAPEVLEELLHRAGALRANARPRRVARDHEQLVGPLALRELAQHGLTQAVRVYQREACWSVRRQHTRARERGGVEIDPDQACLRGTPARLPEAQRRSEERARPARGIDELHARAGEPLREPEALAHELVGARDHEARERGRRVHHAVRAPALGLVAQREVARLCGSERVLLRWV
jgi:hypothetical protein